MIFNRIKWNMNWLSYFDFKEHMWIELTKKQIREKLFNKTF